MLRSRGDFSKVRRDKLWGMAHVSLTANEAVIDEDDTVIAGNIYNIRRRRM